MFQEEKATHAKNDDAKQHNEACNSVEGHIEEDGQEDDGNEKTQYSKEGARALLVPGDDVFILAAKREGAMVKVRFSGLPVSTGRATVLFEEPRSVEIKDGRFDDWFDSDEVHVYRLNRQARVQGVERPLTFE